MFLLIQNFKQFIKKKNRIICLFFISLLFCSCDGSYPPIEADDFGFPKYTVYAMGQNVTGQEGNQLADWELTGYKYSGGIITIMVYNPSGSQYVWSPWLCAGDETLCDNMTAAPFCIDASTSTCSYGPDYCPLTSTAGFCCDQGEDGGDGSSCAGVMYESFPNAPCILQQGQGLYLLITNPSQEVMQTYGNDPNSYPNVNRQPYTSGSYTKGLWYSSGAYQNDNPAMGYNGDLTVPSYPESAYYPASSDDYINGYAYLKILDRYYDDNSGYLYASLKTGFTQIIPPPIQTVMSFLTSALEDTAQNVFLNLVQNSEFRTSLKSLLVMYIVVHGIMYMGGLIQMSQKDFASMSIRLIIVIQLLTTTASWTLFNTYFFNFFTGGLTEMIDIITGSLPGTGEFSFFDSLLGLLFSYETNVKIFALITSFPCGILVAIIMYISFAIFILAIAQSVMIYLLAYMAIDLLIIVGPIFISFMLFETTKSLFENWLNLFCSYFLQAVVVMAAISLLAQIIVDYIYLILGFEACYNDWLSVDFSGTNFVIAKTWMICPFYNTTDAISVPGYWYDTNTGLECDPYECTDIRYVNLPFLDTDSQADLISAFSDTPTGTTGNMDTLMLYNATILLLVSYLMMKFNEITPKLGKGLAGGSDSGSALGDAARSINNDIGALSSGFKNAALKISTGKSQAEREKWMRTKALMIKRQSLAYMSEKGQQVSDAVSKNVVAPTTAAVSYAAGKMAGAATSVAGTASRGVSAVATRTARSAETLKESALYKVTKMTKEQRQKQISHDKNKLLYNLTGTSQSGRQEFVQRNFTVSDNNKRIIKETGQSALNVGKKALFYTASASMKAAGSIYKSGKAVAPTSIYSLAGFMKDMIIPPGSLMGFDYSPKEAADYKSRLLAARNQIKQRDAQEEKDVYDKFQTKRKEKYFADDLKPIRAAKTIIDEEFNNAVLNKSKRLGRDLNEEEVAAIKERFTDRYQKTDQDFAEIDKKYKEKFKASLVKRLEYDPKEIGENGEPIGYKYEKSHREKLVEMFKKNASLGGVSIADIEARAAEFDRKRRDEYGDTLGMALFKAGLGNIDKIAYYSTLAVGGPLYGTLLHKALQTKSGKAASDKYSELKDSTLSRIDKMKQNMVKRIRDALLDPEEQQKPQPNNKFKEEQKAKRRKFKAEKLRKQEEARDSQKLKEKQERGIARQKRKDERYAAKLEAAKRAEEDKLTRGAGAELKAALVKVLRRDGTSIAKMGDAARAASIAKGKEAAKSNVSEELNKVFKTIRLRNQNRIAKMGDEARAASIARVAKPEGGFFGDPKFVAEMAERRKKADLSATEGVGKTLPTKKDNYTYTPPTSSSPIDMRPQVTKDQLTAALAKRTKTSEKLTEEIDTARAERIKPKNISPLEAELQSELTRRKSAKRTEGGEKARADSVDRAFNSNRDTKLKKELLKEVRNRDLFGSARKPSGKESLFEKDTAPLKSKEDEKYLFLDEKEKKERQDLFGDRKESVNKKSVFEESSSPLKSKGNRDDLFLDEHERKAKEKKAALGRELFGDDKKPSGKKPLFEDD